MGRQAASDIANDLRQRLARQHHVRILFAAAPSQSEMLAALVSAPNIDWPRVTAFHMDEYLGLSPDAPQQFGNWLRRAIFDRLPFGAIHLIRSQTGPSADPESAAAEYALLLDQAPIDLVCLGIGVNGHLAFNDPPADLHDPAMVKVVQLDAACRKQQVDDGLFATLADVPERALTVTIPTLLRAHRLYCCVPGESKREAVRRALTDPIGPDFPATALRLHPHCALYLDPASTPK
jgi:glucosamine-6-phosphate deaminase